MISLGRPLNDKMLSGLDPLPTDLLCSSGAGFSLAAPVNITVPSPISRTVFSETTASRAAPVSESQHAAYVRTAGASVAGQFLPQLVCLERKEANRQITVGTLPPTITGEEVKFVCSHIAQNLFSKFGEVESAVMLPAPGVALVTYKSKQVCLKVLQTHSSARPTSTMSSIPAMPQKDADASNDLVKLVNDVKAKNGNLVAPPASAQTPLTSVASSRGKPTTAAQSSHNHSQLSQFGAIPNALQNTAAAASAAPPVQKFTAPPRAASASNLPCIFLAELTAYPRINITVYPPTNLTVYRHCRVPDVSVKRSHERLADICQAQFGPDYSRESILSAISEVRQSNNNRLSGLAEDVIIKRVRQLVKPGRPKGNLTPIAPWANATTPQQKPLAAHVKKSVKDMKDEDCCICFSVMNQPDQVTKLECNHFFHSKCINDWFRTKRECPLCRTHSVDNQEYPPLSGARLKH
ncbi:hypothetical protein HAZT_HAZT006065 [Hyalella azteca]|uniref:RING-type domain-containing protein n=1 Tax=Hyalella azteca TaxID=294128 RepID=A0A6A0H8T5_HYAAZ|nr:hypothetical protein HAZT_HAZT006065 [Hyalella azteca]